MTENDVRQGLNGRLTVQHDLDLGRTPLIATWQLKAMAWFEGDVDDDPALRVYVHDANKSFKPHKDFRVESTMQFSEAPEDVQAAFIDQIEHIAALWDELTGDDETFILGEAAEEAGHNGQSFGMTGVGRIRAAVEEQPSDVEDSVEDLLTDPYGIPDDVLDDDEPPAVDEVVRPLEDDDE